MKEALGGVIFGGGGGARESIETVALTAEGMISEIGDGGSVGEESSVFGVGLGASIALAGVEQALGSRLDQSRLSTPTPTEYFRDFVYSDACGSDIGSSYYHPTTRITIGSLINHHQAFEWLTRNIESLKCTRVPTTRII
jgi:hypothetical protein